LSSTFCVLSSRPELDEEASAEIVAVCGPRGIDADSIERVRDLTFSRMVLLESMRLYPPLWTLYRTPKRDYEAGGHRFPGRTTDQYPHLRDPPGSEELRAPVGVPSAALGTKTAEGAYLSFGAGGRACLGESLPMTRALIILSIFLARFCITAGPLRFDRSAAGIY
jgi:cytochrome P450